MMSRSTFSQRITRYLIQGLIFMLPVLATIGALAYIYNILDRAIFSTLPYYGPYFKILMVIGVAVVFILFIILCGFLLTSPLLAGPMLRVVESIFERIPLVKLIYTSIKDMVEAFMGDKKRFNKPVVVTIQRDPLIQRPGFITAEDLTQLGLKDRVVVYFPLSYSLTGELLIVRPGDVERLEGVNSTEMMKFIISGGVTDLDDIRRSGDDKKKRQ